MAWGKRFTVAVLVGLCASIAATVNPAPANAYYDAITTATDWEVVNGWLNSQTANPVTDHIASKPTQANTWNRAKLKLGRIPKLGVGGSGTLALGAGALYLGWEIPHWTGASDWIYGRIAGVNGQSEPTSGTIRVYIWKAGVASGGIYSGAGIAPDSSTSIWVPIARYSENSGSSWSERAGYVSGCVTQNASPCNNGTFTNLRDGAYLNSYNAALYDAFAGAWSVSGSYTYSENGDTVKTTAWGESLEAFTARINATETRAYNSSTDAARKNYTNSTSDFAQPAPAYGSTLQEEVEEIIEEDDELATKIGTILHPSTGGGSTSDPVLLPQPRLNETYVQYRTRLRNLGFLGTVVLSELGVPDPMFGPSAVTGIEVDVGTATIQTYDLIDPWPEPPPTLTVPGTTTIVTVTANPSTAPAPAPGEPGSAADPPPGSAPPPGGGGTINVGDCVCPAPDFSPITDADLGDKFPFGIVALVGGVLGTTLYAAPDAPSFDLVVNEGQVGGYSIPGGGVYAVDLEVMDDYVALVRTIISWCIWIGGLWWFGTRWLGFKGTGDVGAGVDEAY